MQIFRNILSAWMFSVEDKNRRWVDVCSKREKERDRKLSPLPSLLPTLSSLFLSLPLLFCHGNRWTFTQQRSTFRCAAIIAYCERKLSLGQSFRMAVGHWSHNKCRSLTRKWRWLFNANASIVWQITMRSYCVLRNEICRILSVSSHVKYFLKPSSRRCTDLQHMYVAD